MALDLYVFSSKSRQNIEIAVQNRVWAIPKPGQPRMQRQFTTKALKMPVGAHGVFYLSDKQWFTAPFIVASQPDPYAKISDLWEGDFFLPFRIHPLSEAWPWATKSSIMQLLPSLCVSTIAWDEQIYVKPNQVFLPSKVSIRDWEALVEELAVLKELQTA